MQDKSPAIQQCLFEPEIIIPCYQARGVMMKAKLISIMPFGLPESSHHKSWWLNLFGTIPSQSIAD